jgi:hypothetical protein
MTLAQLAASCCFARLLQISVAVAMIVVVVGVTGVTAVVLFLGL